MTEEIEHEDWNGISDIVFDATLPQYQYSQELQQRFLEAAHYHSEPIAVTPRERGYLEATKEAGVLDDFDWLSQNSERFQNDFRAILVDQFGEKKADEFFRLISEFWSDGKSKRERRDIEPLLLSICDYLNEKCGAASALSFAINTVSKPIFTPSELEFVLWANESMLQWVIDDWIAQRPDLSDTGRSAIHVSRGMVTRAPLEEEHISYGVITAYSIAFSVAEQFGTPHADWKGATDQTHCSLIHTEVDTFSKRTLFFSPFIPGMQPNQFELGIIPGCRPDRLAFQKTRQFFTEYFLHPS